MSIKDLSGWPDDQVPAWVRKARERARAERLKLCSCNRHFASRGQVLHHCDTTGHIPLVAHSDDPYIKRQP